MTAKFTYNGVEITVPVSELAEALRQTFGIGTPAQSVPDAQKEVPTSAQTKWPFPTASSSAQENRTAIDFLKLIAEYGMSGVKLDAIMKILRVDHPKAVGSKSAAINRKIEEYGFDPDDVYTNPRDSTGDRSWRPGPALKEAINALEGRKRA